MQRGWNLLELPRRFPLLPQKSLPRALHPYLGEVSENEILCFRLILKQGHDAMKRTVCLIPFVCSPLSVRQPLRVPGVQRHLPGAALLGGVQVHEHPLRQDRALRHLPDPGHQHLPQYHQHLQDQVWQWERRVLPEGEYWGHSDPASTLPCPCDNPNTPKFSSFWCFLTKCAWFSVFNKPFTLLPENSKLWLQLSGIFSNPGTPMSDSHKITPCLPLSVSTPQINLFRTPL